MQGQWKRSLAKTIGLKHTQELIQALTSSVNSANKEKCSLGRSHSAIHLALFAIHNFWHPQVIKHNRLPWCEVSKSWLRVDVYSLLTASCRFIYFNCQTNHSVLLTNKALDKIEQTHNSRSGIIIHQSLIMTHKRCIHLTHYIFTMYNVKAKPGSCLQKMTITPNGSESPINTTK